MLKLSFATLCLSVVMLAGPAFAQGKQAEAVIGTLMEVEGTAWVSSPVTKTKTAAKVETPLHINDVVDTGPKSRVFILFIDNTQITLSANTKFRAEDYVFDESAPAQNKARYNVMNGTFQYQSGAIAKKKNPDVEVETAYGAIGIRGTKFWAGDIENAYGVNVEEGRVRVRNEGGEVYVDKGKGTSLKSRKQKPSTAAPWPAKQLQLIAATVLLSRQDEVLKRVMGFQGKNNMLRGQFKDFLKMKGGMPGLDNMPGNIVPGQKGGMLFDIPGGTGPVRTKPATTPGGRIRSGDKATPTEAAPVSPGSLKTSPFKMFKVPGL
jgi:hypothetical protein